MDTLKRAKKEFKARIVLPIVDSIKKKTNSKETDENLNNFNIIAGLSNLNLHGILLSKNDTSEEHFESSLDTSHEGDNNDIQSQTLFTFSRVDKFKTEIYQDIIYLLKLYEITDDKKRNKELKLHDNDTLSSYVSDVFSKIENVSSINCNKKDKIYEKIRENFSPKSAIEIYAALVQILVKHELETSASSAYQWTEKFCPEAETILTLYAEYQSLDEPYISYAKWIAYTEIDQFKKVNPDIFDKLLDNLILKQKNHSKKHKTAKKLKTKILKKFKNKSNLDKIKDSHIYTLRFPRNHDKEEIKNTNDVSNETNQNYDISALFWECSRMLLNNILSFVHKLHVTSTDGNLDIKVVILEKTYLIIKRLAKIHPNQIEDIDFESQLKESLTDGSIDYFIQNINHKLLVQSDKNSERINELVNILRNAAEYIKKFDDNFGSIFKSCYNISIPEILFHAYDSHLVNFIHPVISEISNEFEDTFKTHSNDSEECFSKIFELYHEIRNFLKNATDAYEIHNLKLLECSQDWFLAGIETWREASSVKVLFRIEKSIDVDKLKPEFDNSTYSSSAIDTMQLLYATKTFWENLELFYKREDLLKEITYDLCCSVIFYIEKFIEKIRNSRENRDSKMRIELQANIQLVSANQNYIMENFKELIREFSNADKSDEDEIQNQFKKTEASVNDEISDYFDFEIRKFCLIIEKAVDINSSDENHSEATINEIENILASDLPTANYQEIAQMLWNNILEAISGIIQKATNEKKMEDFFLKLLIFFTRINKLFSSIEELTIDKDIKEKIEQIKYKLQCYSQETDQLIHQYYKDRYKMQKDSTESSMNGSLTIFCCFIDDNLKIEILNARNLPVSELNKKCDSYVKVRLVPEQKFPNFQCFKTKVQYNTIFPLFDENFQKPLTKEQQNLNDSIICFSIKEKSLVAGDAVLAEAFLSFEDIPKVTSNDKLQQTHLPLTKLQNDEIESLKAISYRSQLGDVQALEFLTKLRRLPRASLMMKQIYLNFKDLNIKKSPKY